MGADAGEAAKRVVVTAVREVVEPAGEVHGVGPGERHPRGRGRQGLGACREGALPLLAVAPDRADRDVPERRRGPRQLHEVVGGAGPPDHAGQVADRRLRALHEAAQLGGVGLELLDDGLGVPHQRVEVVQRRPQVHVGGVGAPHERRQLPDRVGQGVRRPGDRVCGVGQVRHEPGQVVAPLRDVAHQPRRLDDEAAQLVLVAGQLAEQAAGGHDRRIEVQPAGVRGLALARVLARGAPEDAAQRIAGPAVEGGEDLVEFDVGGGVLGAEHGAIGQLAPVAGRGQSQIHVAAGRAGQAELADLGVSAAGQRRPVVVDRKLELGQAVVGQPLVDHRADLPPRDFDQPALHHLAGVLEARVDPVVGGAAEHHEAEQRGGGHDQGDREPSDHPVASRARRRRTARTPKMAATIRTSSTSAPRPSALATSSYEL